MSTREFRVCIAGLPEQAQFTQAWQQMPQQVNDPADIAAVFGSFLGEPLTTE